MFRLAAVWDARYRGGLYEAAPPLPEVARFVERHLDRLTPSDPILDLGCGNGRHLRSLRRSATVAGTDVSGQGLRNLATTLEFEGETAPLVRAIHAALPFGAGAFAAALAVQSIQDGSLDDARAALAEVWRVVRPGGAVFVRVPQAAGDPGWRHDETEEAGTIRFLAGPKAGLAVHRFTAEDVSSLARDTGFDVVEGPAVVTAPRIPPLVGTMPYLDAVLVRSGLRPA